jgi:threonine/homoserine/homoserine lactone efflux protein
MVFISWFGLSSLFASEKAQLIIGLIGGAVIIIFGVYNFTKKQIMQPTRSIVDIKTKFHFKYFAKGFIFNVANPGVWIYWLLPISVASSYNTNEQILFLAFILITVLLMDIVKCAIANELKNFLTIKVVLVINRVVGVILIIFGIYLACSPFFPDVNLLDISK